MSQIAKIMPNSLEAEQGIIACILLDDKVPLSVFPLLKKEDFYANSHKTIYEAMNEIYNNGKPVDFITLVDKLESKNKLEEVGGIDYITSLTNLLPSALNYKHYVDIIKNHACRRRLITASQEIAEKSFDNEKSAEVLNFAEQQIFKISESEQTSSLERIDKSLQKVMDKLDTIAQNSGELRGIPTGFADLDAITNGLQNSDLILLAARPGVGKTSLSMNIINNSAILSGKSCAVFSLEMPKEQIAQRSLCSIACVSMAKALNGTLNDEEWQSLWHANKKIADAKIFIDDNSLNTPSDILSKCRRLKLEFGLDLVMIDYLQLMKSGSAQLNRVLEIGEITRFLKISAKELNVPIILLSQLSRQVDSRPDHRPVLSDLRDSGTIEQDADIVMFIYNPDKYNDVVREEGEEGIVELELAKHRNGSTGKIKLRWLGEYLKFVDKDDKSIRAPKPSTQTKQSGNNSSADNTPPETYDVLPPDDYENLAPPPDDAPPFSE